MKQRLLLTFALFLSFLHLQARVLFVRYGGTGDGSSWQSALGSLQSALSKARMGDEIWVASGTYTPSQNDRNASFVIPSGVKVLGGFSVKETSIAQRDFTVNRTILSGEIGSPGIDDNSFTVVVVRNAAEGTLLDGFEISGGNANNPLREVTPSNCGGGLFNDATGGSSSVTISNCFFKMNKALYGGGLYNNAGNGNCSGTKVLNCDFYKNDAKVDGGAVFNQGGSGVCNLMIQNCNFEDNQAYYGAGILNQAISGEASPTIENCTFFGNGSVVRGSPIYNHREQNGTCNPVLRGCRFDNNTGAIGTSNVGGNTTGPTQQQEEVKKNKKPIMMRPTTAY